MDEDELKIQNANFEENIAIEEFSPKLATKHEIDLLRNNERLEIYQ